MLKNIWKWLFMYFRKNPDKIPCLYYYHMTLTLPTQLHIIKAVIFPIVMYGCETWTIKDEHWRIDALELWCWKNLLRIPWTARRSNQSILKGINPAYSTWGLMLKLNLQYLDHLKWRVDALEKTLMLGKIEGKRRRGR